MRTWGRVPANSENYSGDTALLPISDQFPNGYVWVEVATDANGFNDAVWLTTFIQILQLNLNESPFYGNYGIPAQQDVITQQFPDYYVMLMQQVFSVYFLSLIATKLTDTSPVYNIDVTPNVGAVMLNPIPV